jgi:hypothetical protein
MEQRGDLTGALLAALLVRHLIRDKDLDRSLGFSPVHLYGQVRQSAQRAFPGIARGDTVVGPFDDILAHLQHLTGIAAQDDQAPQ